MNIRTSKPEAGNKFYITTSKGGYSRCIQGSPTDSQCNVLANCVGYACGRFNEIIGSMKYPNLNCNAENFIERAQSYGLQISPVPTLGGIMVWKKGNTLSGNDGAGHVAIVEKIIDSNTIYTSESGYGSSAFWNSIRTNNNGRWGLGSGYTFRGCIVNPAIGNVSAPTVTKPDPFAGVSDEELARRVWTGEFGNGQDRKNALGSRYNTVQALVDKGVGKPAPTPQPAAPAPSNELKVGDRVKITGTGNGSSMGTSNTAYGIGWERQILKIWSGRPFPYQVGNSTGTTGFYKETSLQKM